MAVQQAGVALGWGAQEREGHWLPLMDGGVGPLDSNGFITLAGKSYEFASLLP